MQYNYNKILNKELYNKCITRNINKTNILDNYKILTIDVEEKTTQNLREKVTNQNFLANQNNKNVLLTTLSTKRQKNLQISLIREKFKKNTKLRYSFLIKPSQNGFIYYTSQNFGFFSKNFLKAFIIILKKLLSKTKNLPNKMFLCNLHKNQHFIISKLKVLSNNIAFFMKFDKKNKKNQIFISQKFVLPIRIKYAKNKNKKTNKNNFKYNKKKENFSHKIFYNTKNQNTEIFRKNIFKFNIK